MRKAVQAPWYLIAAFTDRSLLNMVPATSGKRHRELMNMADDRLDKHWQRDWRFQQDDLIGTTL